VSAPLIKECYANFECRLTNASLISKYDLFIWEVVKRIFFYNLTRDPLQYLIRSHFAFHL